MNTTGIAAFVERYGDESAEVLWWAALGWVDRAAAEARAPNFGRWRYYPRGELRRLRRDLAAALALARLAVAIQEDENDMLRELTREAREVAEEAGRKRRRQGTLQAEKVRLENARRRRERKQ